MGFAQAKENSVYFYFRLFGSNSENSVVFADIPTSRLSCTPFLVLLQITTYRCYHKTNFQD